MAIYCRKRGGALKVQGRKGNRRRNRLHNGKPFQRIGLLR